MISPASRELKQIQANDYVSKAEEATRSKRHEDAATYYFHAAELFEDIQSFKLAAECYKHSFVNKLSSSSLLKDNPDEKYVGNMESLYERAKDPHGLEHAYGFIEKVCRQNYLIDLSDKFYLKKMTVRQNLFKNKNIIKWLGYFAWGKSSSYGLSLNSLLKKSFSNVM